MVIGSLVIFRCVWECFVRLLLGMCLICGCSGSLVFGSVWLLGLWLFVILSLFVLVIICVLWW